jgi:hypothetical protein
MGPFKRKEIGFMQEEIIVSAAGEQTEAMGSN